MARVVQQRTSPPYLLIAMVFLFLVATTVAVLYYMQSDKLNKQIAEDTATYDRIAVRRDLNDPEVKQMMAAPGKQTVVKQLQKQLTVSGETVDELAGLIAGSGTDAKKAISQAEEAFDMTGADNLAAGMLEINKQLSEARKDLQAARAELADKQALVDTTKESLQADAKRLEQNVSTLQGELNAKHAEYKKELADAMATWEDLRNLKDVKIEQLSSELGDQKKVNRTLRRSIDKLKEELREKTATGTDPMQTARVPDGKVLMVSDEGRLCYIDLGSKDKIKPGLSFSVYPNTGIPPDGKGKATIVVTNVEENTSECRLVTQIPGDPIVIDDFIANVAFDPTRQFKFAVIGNFDLYGTGTPTSAGAKEAAILIERFGGTIVKEVGLDTDFVVRGDAPEKPIKPEPATPQEYQVYLDQLRIHAKFTEVNKLAESLKVPILNTNKFLAFIGYNPTPAGG